MLNCTTSRSTGFACSNCRLAELRPGQAAAVPHAATLQHFNGFETALFEEDEDNSVDEDFVQDFRNRLARSATGLR
jgi:hypothetical protein